MLVGIGFFALPTATVAATFVRQDEKPEELREELREISARLERIERALVERKGAWLRSREGRGRAAAG